MSDKELNSNGNIVLTKDAKMFKKLLKEKANLNRENDRLNDELENLKEAYGGEIDRLTKELSDSKAEALIKDNENNKHWILRDKFHAYIKKLEKQALILDKALEEMCWMYVFSKFHEADKKKIELLKKHCISDARAKCE